MKTIIKHTIKPVWRSRKIHDTLVSGVFCLSKGETLADEACSWSISALEIIVCRTLMARKKVPMQEDKHEKKMQNVYGYVYDSLRSSSSMLWHPM